MSKQAYASALSGKGAAIKGERWNSVGVEILYTATNRSLAMAEVAVHFSLATMPSDYVMVTIYIPDRVSLHKVHINDLPADWNTFPHPSTTQAIGDKFITDNKFCLLQIPSAVTQGDYNLLINPNHSEFKQIEIIATTPFPLDGRIFK